MKHKLTLYFTSSTYVERYTKRSEAAKRIEELIERQYLIINEGWEVSEYYPMSTLIKAVIEKVEE